MISNYGFGSNLYRPGQREVRGKTVPPLRIFGRVVDIILDSRHPKYEEYGQTIALNGVFYVPLGKSSTEDIDEPIEFAYSGNANLELSPLKNEIVLIEKLPSFEGREDNYTSKKAYWTRLVPLWNHPQHNAYPDTLQFGNGPVNLGEDFVELSNIAPLQRFPGDMVIEGRHGQSIRLSGVYSKNTPWESPDKNGAPLMYLRVGQKTISTGDQSTVEDVNKDTTSVLLTSNQKVTLTPANDKFDAWKQIPEAVGNYTGAQFMVNTDRVVLNSKIDHVLISSKKSIGLTGTSVSLDGKDYIGLDATKIYLGKSALQLESEPVLLGQTSTEWLKDLVNQIETLVNTLSKLPAAPSAAIPQIIAVSNTIRPALPGLKARLKSLHSKKVYTE